MDGKKRPVLNSIGNRIHYSDEGIVNFWKWFNDSKVVDLYGHPIICYHGTHSEFDEFKVNSDLGGIFVSQSPAEANVFTGYAYGRVIPVYVKSLKPYGKTVRSYYEAKKAVAAAKKGYDAIRVTDGFDSEVNWCVFSPNQLKSAVGNSGKFDVNEKSITACDA